MRNYQEIVNNKIQQALDSLKLRNSRGEITFAEKQFGEKALFSLKDELNKLFTQMNKDN